MKISVRSWFAKATTVAAGSATRTWSLTSRANRSICDLDVKDEVVNTVSPSGIRHAIHEIEAPRNGTLTAVSQRQFSESAGSIAGCGP